jgi:hypothetical protein
MRVPFAEITPGEKVEEGEEEGVEEDEEADGGVDADELRGGVGPAPGNLAEGPKLPLIDDAVQAVQAVHRVVRLRWAAASLAPSGLWFPGGG